MTPLSRHIRGLMGRADFLEWNAGNALVDDEGLPLVWLHGTDPDTDFNLFTRWDENSIGFHVGGNRAATTRVQQMNGHLPETERMQGSLMPVLVRANNPLRMCDHHTWGQRQMADELLELGVIAESDWDVLVDNFDCAYIFAALELAGHDAVLYANVTEADKAEDSLFVWRAEQMKSPLATSFRVGEPRLQPQHPVAAEDLVAWSALADEIDAAKAELLASRAVEAAAAAPGPR